MSNQAVQNRPPGGVTLAFAAALAIVWAVPAQAQQAPQAPPAPSVEIRNAKLLGDDLLLGGQPTREQLQEIAEAGYVTVIDLRMPDEDRGFDEPAVAKELGLGYHSLPVAGADGMTRENASRLAELLADTERRPVVIHCGSGNRVGGLLALQAFYVDGLSADEALQLGLDNGLTSLSEAVREHLRRAGSQR